MEINKKDAKLFLTHSLVLFHFILFYFFFFAHQMDQKALRRDNDNDKFPSHHAWHKWQIPWMSRGERNKYNTVGKCLTVKY
jgi:hypothetical protein